MAKSSTSHKSAHCPHSAVKWPHWVRKKIDNEILGIFEQILLYECTKVMKFIIEQKKFEILSNFDIFKIEISLSKIIAILKSVQICLNQKIWDHISQKTRFLKFTFRRVSPCVLCKSNSFRIKIYSTFTKLGALALLNSAI